MFSVNVYSNEENDSINEHINEHKKLNDLQKQIVALVEENNQITLDQMADKLKKGKITIRRSIASMNILHFVGPGKGGHWEISE